MTASSAALRHCETCLKFFAIINIFVMTVVILNERLRSSKVPYSSIEIQLNYMAQEGRLRRSSSSPSLSLKNTVEEAFIMNLDQADPRLAKWIRNNHLFPPLPLPSSIPERMQRNWYADYVLHLFMKKIIRKEEWKGVFVEVGANDGVKDSISLFLEEMGWTGLLVECNPMLFPKLKSKNRKALISDACLSPITKPKSSVTFNTTCFPLFSILMAAKIRQVDFLSLDVGGSEVDMLKGFPFHQIPIKIMIIKFHYTVIGEQKEDLRSFLQGKGYRLRLKDAVDAYVLKSDPDLS